MNLPFFGGFLRAYESPYLRAERSRLYPEGIYPEYAVRVTESLILPHRSPRFPHGFPPFLHRGVGPARERAQRQRAAWEPPLTNIECKTPDEG